MQAPLPSDEAVRLEALRRYEILDTAPEAQFDDLTFLASLICGTPISALTLVDQERQWFKSRVGLDVPETSRDVSFCAHAILGDDLLQVADASADERFADNPLVTDEPHIRFYAGVPLVTPEGLAMGSLCVVDTVPRELSATQQDALRRLGRQAVALLEGRPDASAQGQSRQARQKAEMQRLSLAAQAARRDAEELRFSETRYRRLFESAKDGILILDAASGQIEDVNPYLCELLGFEREDFVGKQLWEIGTFRDIAASKDAFRILQEREYIRYDDLPLETKDGRRVSVEFVSNVYPCSGKDVIQCNIRDISERKRAASAELEAKRFLQSTLDALSSHVAVLDETGTIIAVNRMWREFAEENEGTAASCGVGANYLRVCDDANGAWTDDAPILAREIRRAMTDPSAEFSLEYPCHSPARQRWFNVCLTRFQSEELVRVVVAHDDISARKLAQLQVIASEANLATAQQIAHLGSWELDLSEDEFLSNPLHWSDEIFRMLGFAPGQFEPSNELFFASVHPDDRERVSRAMAEAISGGAPYSVEHRVVLPDGTERMIHAQARLLRDEETGRPVKMVGTGQDITQQKRTEESLVQSSELLRAITEGTADIIYAKDAAGRYLMANQACARLLGYPVKEIVGKTDIELLPPQAARRLRESDRAIMAGGESQTREESGLGVGEPRTLLATKGPLRGSNGDIVGVVGISRDITQRKQAEQALEATTRDLLTIWESMTDGFFALDTEWRFTHLNSQAAAIWKKSADELIGQVIWDAFPGSRETRFGSEYNRAKAEGVPVNFEAFYAPDNAWREVHAYPSALGLSVYFRDITARKQAEASQARLVAILEATPDLVAIADNLQQAVYLNRAGRLLMGIPPDADASQLDISKYCAPWAKDVQQKGVMAAIRDGSWSGETAVLSSDGREIPVSQVIIAHKSGDGEVEFLSTIARDISERKRSEAELQRANEELEARVQGRTRELGTANESLRVENLEHQRTLEFLRQVAQQLTAAKEEADQANMAKPEFLSRMSHELRTPLNAILGFGQILENQDLSPLSRESVGFILSGGRHLLDLINEILDIARVEAGRLEISLEPVSLAEAVSQACDLVRPLGNERSIQLSDNSLTLDGHFVLADRQRLKQVLINLLSNAIKYNREGGQVEVLCVPRADGWTSISVRDTGVGMAPDDLLKLFTPFERLGASTEIEGTGLGLVLSRRLVMAMGAILNVESTLDVGTTFSLELPQTVSPEETLAKTTQLPFDAFPKRATEQLYRVLYIEDNPSNLRLLEVIFQDHADIAMMTATQGFAGLEMARDQEPDLILLDLNLPDMHGKDVLARLQQSAITRDIPVIVISADATPSQMKHVLSAGARAYLTKPLDVEQFLRTLDTFRLGNTSALTPIEQDEENT